MNYWKRIIRLTLITAGCGSTLGPVAKATDTGLYPEGFYGWYEFGPSLVEQTKVTEFAGAPLPGGELKLNPGLHFGVAMGQELTRWLSLEVESGFNYNSIDEISGATASNGDISRVPVLANLVFRWSNQSGWTPVAGVGLGGQWQHFSAEGVTIGATTLDDTSDTWSFTYQGYAGVRYDLNERISLGIFYRYNVADAPAWKFDSLPVGRLKTDDLRTHSLSVTLGWYF